MSGALKEAVERVTAAVDKRYAGAVHSARHSHRSTREDYHRLLDDACAYATVAGLSLTDLRTILTALATQSATLEAMASALEAADQFITNGVALGFIRMPDPETPDSALLTPGLIRATLNQYRQGDL